MQPEHTCTPPHRPHGRPQWRSMHQMGRPQTSQNPPPHHATHHTYMHVQNDSMHDDIALHLHSDLMRSIAEKQPSTGDGQPQLAMRLSLHVTWARREGLKERSAARRHCACTQTCTYLSCGPLAFWSSNRGVCECDMVRMTYVDSEHGLGSSRRGPFSPAGAWGRRPRRGARGSAGRRRLHTRTTGGTDFSCFVRVHIAVVRSVFVSLLK